MKSSPDGLPPQNSAEREVVIAAAIKPYQQISDRLFDAGVAQDLPDQLGLSAIYGEQQIKAAGREAEAFDDGIYAPGSPESLFPVRDGVFPFYLTDSEYSGHQHWLTETLPIQQACSVVGKRAVDSLTSHADFTEEVASQLMPKRAASVMDIVVKDGVVTDVYSLSDAEIDDFLLGANENPAVSIEYVPAPTPLMEIMVRNIDGRSLRLSYRKWSDPESPSNGWTVTDSQLIDGGDRVQHRIQSRDIDPSDINLVSKALDLLDE